MEKGKPEAMMVTLCRPQAEGPSLELAVFSPKPWSSKYSRNPFGEQPQQIRKPKQQFVTKRLCRKWMLPEHAAPGATERAWKDCLRLHGFSMRRRITKSQTVCIGHASNQPRAAKVILLETFGLLRFEH